MLAPVTTRFTGVVVDPRNAVKSAEAVDGIARIARLSGKQAIRMYLG